MKNSGKKWRIVYLIFLEVWFFAVDLPSFSSELWIRLSPEVVSKPQIVFEGKAQAELKAQHTR
jgi:hypothetical protein